MRRSADAGEYVGDSSFLEISASADASTTQATGSFQPLNNMSSATATKAIAAASRIGVAASRSRSSGTEETASKRDNAASDNRRGNSRATTTAATATTRERNEGRRVDLRPGDMVIDPDSLVIERAYTGKDQETDRRGGCSRAAGSPGQPGEQRSLDSPATDERGPVERERQADAESPIPIARRQQRDLFRR